MRNQKQHRVGGRLLALPPKSFRQLIVYLRKCLQGDPQAESVVNISSVDSTEIVKNIRYNLL